MKIKSKKKTGRSNRRKRNSLLDLAWQGVGLVTIFVIFIVFVFGDPEAFNNLGSNHWLKSINTDNVVAFDFSLGKNR
ncbi:MAG: hypothetical protein VX438_17930 [Planctomycetota bacterium]|jgi:hypothetical protein|nr:hypothetical protein [Planctomycetota bacterium]